ncbi:hypothetical protein L6164_023707 [Bauhinia variegata]|uniref:Uncharacterized protein n=1 Tax=Bauhinia variegata TaxID=167791 RepID=A0ACB9MJ61_BAUVA|nr:hypothetical protein L6164_023707 [Bauhinia variegata]
MVVLPIGILVPTAQRSGGCNITLLSRYLMAQVVVTLDTIFDLASFVACVSADRSWHSKCSLTLSRGTEEQMAFRDEDVHSDPFVENFVMERLSVKSPLRIFMVNVIISLLHMDNLCLNLIHFGSPGSDAEMPHACPGEHCDQTTISFTNFLLDMLCHNIP